MKKLLVLFSIIQVFCLFILKDKIIKGSLAQTGNPFASKVILMVWDGVQKNHLNELLTTGKLPNLQNLINEGRIKDMEIYTTNCGCTNDGDNYHTETGPAHAAMLTGYGFLEMDNHSNWERPEQCENNCPQICPSVTPPSRCPELLNPFPDDICFAKLGPRPIPQGRTIFERLKVFNPNIKTALITGKAARLFPFPALIHAAPTTCCYQILNYRACGDNTTNPIDTCQPSNESNSTVGNRFLDFLDQNYNSPFFLFSHLKNPDDVAHLEGENSEAYTNTLIEDDLELGKVVQKLKDLNIYNQTVILVTTDHGMAEGGIGPPAHHVCIPETKQIWIVSNKRNVIDKQGVIAKQTSIVPTLFDIFGMDKNVSPSFPAESLFSSLPTPACPNGERGNLNCDGAGRIDVDDLDILKESWAPLGPVPTPAQGQHPANLNEDNFVNEKDLTILLSHWSP